MKHLSVGADVRELLKEEGMSHLEVFEGNCTGRTMVWVRYPHAQPGSAVALTEDELNVLRIIFGEWKPQEGPVYSFGAWKAKAAMALGMWPKQLPVCDRCGLVFRTEAGVAQCTHPKREPRVNGV